MIESFVLTLPLKVELWQADILNKRYEHLSRIYNTVQRRLLRHYIYLSKQKKYRQCKTDKDKQTFWETHPITFKGICDKNGKPVIVKFPYTEKSRSNKSGKKASNGISDFVSNFWRQNIGNGLNYRSMGINAGILNNLGLQIERAWRDRIYDQKSKRISFKKEGDLGTFGSKRMVNGGFSGFELDLEKMTLSININGKKGGKAKKINLPINPNRELTAYEKEALKDKTDNIKKIVVSRKYICGRYKYYVQLTIKGEKPLKNRKLGKGTVGIDVGPSTIAVSSQQSVSLDKLADKCDNIEHSLWRINRKMERSRRATNPEFFDNKGRYIKIKKGEFRKWSFSNRYKCLKSERRELYRKQTAIRKRQHIDMANVMLEQGDNFIVEDNPIDSWARRAKKDTKNKDGKPRCKRRYGKSIADHAPAMFVSILNKKITSLGGKFEKVSTKNAATQFDFTNGKFTRRKLSERKVTLSDGRTHQRDMLSAFNLQHLNTDGPKEKVKDYNIKQMAADYPVFCALEQKGIAQFRNTRRQERDVAYFIGATHKTLKFSSVNKANRHIGDVGRDNCKHHEGNRIVAKAASSLDTVSVVPHESHQSNLHHCDADG